MVDMTENEDRRAVIKSKLRQNFDGKIVRKDLTKKIKEGANVPVYVLEFLLGQYCSSDDPDIIEEGVENVKRILADNFVRPDEAQKILSVLRQRGSYTVIDKITVNLNIKRDFYEAEFSNLGLKNLPIDEEYPAKFDRLLCGGIWCIVQLDYEYMEEDRNGTPISIRKLTPIQMPHVDIEELKQGRKAFTQDEWMDVLLRSIGMEPDTLTYREKWLLLIRMIPLVENNFNLCELGPRSTGKSHLYKEISPNSILVSGGQTTVANLFYNMGRKTVGLVGLWDCVAFDEVAGIHFKDKDGIQIMKDYMASGSFARGKEEKKRPRLPRWYSLEISIRAWMCCSRHPAFLTPSRLKWVRIRLSLTGFTAIFPVGKSRSSARSISQMTMGLSRIIWRSLSGSCARSSMGMRWINISV